MKALALAREVFSASVSHRMQSAALACLAAAAAVAIVLTSGRSAGLEAAVLSTIDEQGPRTITVQATAPDPNFNSDLVQILDLIPHTAQVVGLGEAQDATLAATPEGPRIGLRRIYSESTEISLGRASEFGAQLTPAAIQSLGLDAPLGTLRVLEGVEYTIDGIARLPKFLDVIEPLAVVEGGVGEAAEKLASIYVLADTTRDLPLVLRQLKSYTEDFDEDEVKVSTAPELAALRDAVGGQLTKGNGATLLGITGAGTLLVTIASFAFVLNQRKSYGRRRALGASRRLLLALVVGEVAMGVVVGSIVGVAAGATWLAIEGNPLPRLAYLVALAVFVSLASAVGAVIPGMFAAGRDPVRELRVP